MSKSKGADGAMPADPLSALDGCTHFKAILDGYTSAKQLINFMSTLDSWVAGMVKDYTKIAKAKKKDNWVDELNGHPIFVRRDGPISSVAALLEEAGKAVSFLYLLCTVHTDNSLDIIRAYAVTLQARGKVVPRHMFDLVAAGALFSPSVNGTPQGFKYPIPFLELFFTCILRKAGIVISDDMVHTASRRWDLFRLEGDPGAMAPVQRQSEVATFQQGTAAASDRMSSSSAPRLPVGGSYSALAPEPVSQSRVPPPSSEADPLHLGSIPDPPSAPRRNEPGNSRGRSRSPVRDAARPAGGPTGWPVSSTRREFY